MDKQYTKYKNLYFLGIGGIGMSALAQYFFNHGYQVAGYDRFESESTNLLKTMGIPVSVQDHDDALPGHWKLAETAIVFTPAVPQTLHLFQQFKSLGLPFYKRSQVLGWLSQELPTIAIAGTHGKTTTTAIMAHVVKSAGYRVLAFIGGISANYGSNIIMDKDPEYLIVEADEFDRSFLNLQPNWSIITAVDPDHLDIYGNTDSFNQAFEDFAKLTSELTVSHKEVAIKLPENHKIYAGDKSEITARSIEDGRVLVSLKDEGNTVSFSWRMPGKYNAENALATYCISNQLGIPSHKYQAAMETFEGVQRRFEAKYEGVNGVLIDDYAHHPKELAALRSALFELYPDKKITMVFQPHLFSRTRDFLEEFASELSVFHEVLLLPIFPAREEPIPGVNSEALLSEISCENKSLIAPFDLLHFAAKFQGEVLVMAGAGDISKMVEPVRKILASQEA